MAHGGMQFQKQPSRPFRQHHSQLQLQPNAPHPLSNPAQHQIQPRITRQHRTRA